MENLRSTNGFAELVAAAPALQAFTVLGSGCSSGVDPARRLFGPPSVAFGFDPIMRGCDRLAAADEVDEWRGLVSAMEKSTSWRLTEPLRWLRRQFSGNRGW